MGSLQQDRDSERERERQSGSNCSWNVWQKLKTTEREDECEGGWGEWQLGTLETDFEGLQGSLSLHIKLSGLVLLLFFFLLLLLWQLACCGALICMRRNYFSLSHVCKSTACAQRGGAKGRDMGGVQRNRLCHSALPLLNFTNWN